MPAERGTTSAKGQQATSPVHRPLVRFTPKPDIRAFVGHLRNGPTPEMSLTRVTKGEQPRSALMSQLGH